MAHVPLPFGAHTLEAYRRLPIGWSTAPKGIATDLYTWQKLLRLPGVRARSATWPTALHFLSPHRPDWTLDERVAEQERWAQNVADPAWRKEFIGEVLDHIVFQAAEIEARALAAYATRTMRLRDWLLRAPGLGSAAKALAARAVPPEAE